MSPAATSSPPPLPPPASAAGGAPFVEPPRAADPPAAAPGGPGLAALADTSSVTVSSAQSRLAAFCGGSGGPLRPGACTFRLTMV